MRHFLWVSLLAVSLAACTSEGGDEPHSSDSPPSASPAPGSPTEPVDGGSLDPVHEPSQPGAATDVELTLSWQPSADPVAGYRVYFGPTDDATTPLSEIRAEDLPAAPAVTYNAGTQLGLNHGDRVCFRVRAYDDDGALSNWSQPTCTTI